MHLLSLLNSNYCTCLPSDSSKKVAKHAYSKCAQQPMTIPALLCLPDCGWLNAVLSHVHASLGALQTYKQQGREFVVGNFSFLEGSPFMSMDSNPHGNCALGSMECAVICYYNFLANIDKEGGLDKYDFGTWDFNAFDGYPRWSINTFIFKGSDLNKEEILADDEKSIAVLLPEIKKVHSGAVGKAIVVHLSYKPQRVDGLEQQTNVAAHYVALARKLTGPLLDV